MVLKVASWNIWQSKHVEEVGEKLLELQPDIIGLQEVIESNGVNAGAVIAKRLGYRHFFCKSVDATKRVPPINLGNSILSKYELRTSSCHFLSTAAEYINSPETEPRTAQMVTLSYEGKELNVVNLHLGFSPNLTFTPIQKIQLERLLPLLAKSPLLVMGDFNSLPQSEVVLTLEKHLKNTDTVKIAPTRFTQRDNFVQKDRIDYIFTSREIIASNFSIEKLPASDHALLSVDIEI